MNKSKLSFLFFFILTSSMLFAQKVVEMEKINNIYQIPCKVNGIEMKFIFDTGASVVSISQTEAAFLIKQGLLEKTDIIKKTKYKIADGNLVEGTIINLKNIEIDGVIITDVKATIVKNQSAPLLFGQSAIKKLGSYTIKDDKLILLDYESEKNEKTISKYSKNFEIDEDALNYFNYFLVNKNAFGYVNSKLTYDNYSESLNFDMERISENSMTGKVSQKINTNFSIPLKKITKIVEIINLKGVHSNDTNFLFYEIYFSEKVKYTYLITKPNELPNQKTDYREKVGISPEKPLTVSDIEKIQQAIRDIFKDITFEQKKA